MIYICQCTDNVLVNPHVLFQNDTLSNNTRSVHTFLAVLACMDRTWYLDHFHGRWTLLDIRINGSHSDSLW